MARASIRSIVVAGAILCAFYFLANSVPSSKSMQKIWTTPQEALAHQDKTQVYGKPIMSKMQNQTARGEVGRSGWKVLHTMLAQYPEIPTENERQTLLEFFHIFSRVYPCRECAEHFQQLLKDFPPQLETRQSAIYWGCHAHNKVNKRLKKEIFDCSKIEEMYDCGCGPGVDDVEDVVREDENKDVTPEVPVGLG